MGAGNVVAAADHDRHGEDSSIEGLQRQRPRDSQPCPKPGFDGSVEGGPSRYRPHIHGEMRAVAGLMWYAGHR